MSDLQDLNNPTIRPPLGLPFGSVRAILSLIIGGVFWALLLYSERSDQLPLSLYFLLALELLFFTAHGYSIASARSAAASPWWLPAGFFRTVIVLGFLLTVGYKCYTDPEQLEQLLTPSTGQLRHWPLLLLTVAGAFLLGRLIRSSSLAWVWWFQDVQAWLAVLSMTGLGIGILIRAFVNPSLSYHLNLQVAEYVLVGIVTLYFGTRC